MATPERSVSSSDVGVGDATKADHYNNLRADMLIALTELDKGTKVNRPSSNLQVSQMYYATDEDIVYISDGSGWRQLFPTPFAVYININNIVGGTTVYQNFGGADAVSSSESGVAGRSPIAVRLSDMRVDSSNGPGGGQTVDFTVRKEGSDTSLTVQLTGAETQGDDTSNTVDVAVGDLLSLKMVASAGANTLTRTSVTIKAEIITS